MVEVGGSNPPGPTNTTDPALCRVFRVWLTASWEFKLQVRPNEILGVGDTERLWREARRDETGQAGLGQSAGSYQQRVSRRTTSKRHTATVKNG